MNEYICNGKWSEKMREVDRNDDDPGGQDPVEAEVIVSLQQPHIRPIVRGKRPEPTVSLGRSCTSLW